MYVDEQNVQGIDYEIHDYGRAKPNGVATLDGNGRIPFSQLPESAMELRGAWNASTNTPELADGQGTLGDLYFVDVGGTQDLGHGPETFVPNDRVVYNGSIWQRLPAGAVDSVNGKNGTVVLTGEDIPVSSENTQTLTDFIVALKAEFLSEAHPVGSYYTSDSPTDPGVLFGGRWNEVTDCILFAKNSSQTAGTTGGNTSGGKITLAEQNIPRHTHTFSGSEVTSGTPSNNTSGTPSNNTSGTPSNNTSGAMSGNSTGKWTGGVMSANLTNATGNLKSTQFVGKLYATGGGSSLGMATLETDVSHTHSLQSHTHSLQSHTHSLQSHTHKVTANGTNSSWGGGLKSGSSTEYETKPIDIMPPVRYVYCWVRIE